MLEAPILISVQKLGWTQIVRKQQMSLFSVVIPTFNRVELLGAALESVFSQRFKQFETIVVNDGSTDGTMNYLHSLGKQVKVFSQPNRGPGAARNLGARNATGKYLAFLDSDDLWFPWTLEVYRDVIQEHKDPSFVAGRPCLFSNKNDVQTARSGTAQSEEFIDYLTSGDRWRWWSVSSFVIRRDAFAEARGFTDEWINGEDADLALRLGVAPGFVQITDPVTFAYREQVSSAMKDLKRTFAGAWCKIRAEQLGYYPGGRARAAERRRILTRHTRPVTLGCLKQGMRREAWMLYRATFAWNATLGRVGYLALVPFIALREELRRVGSLNLK